MPKVIIGRSRALCFAYGIFASLLLSWSSEAWAISRDFVGLDRLTPRLEKESDLLGRRLSLVLSRHERSLRQAPNRCKSGDWGACRLEDWQHFLTEIAARVEPGQLRLVNRYVNSAHYITDLRNWRRPDYWAVPEELFGRGGDCEDYVIAKYLSLRSLGISPKRLRIVVLYDRRRREDHAVLAVFGSEDILVLDNRRRRVLTSPQMRDWYRPYYSLNENSVWIHNAGS